MKKSLIILSLVGLLSSFVFAQNLDSSEILIYNEINSYFQTEYYPGVVEKASVLEKTYPESVFLNPARILKTEALLKLGQFSSAKETCLKVIPTMHLGSESFGKAYYLLGKANYYEQAYLDSIEAFHKACSIAKQEKDLEVYNPSVLFAGRSYFVLSEYKKATPLFEYIVGNGNYYSTSDYEEVLQKLFICYSETKSFDKAVSLYQQLDENKIDSKVFTIITMYGAEASLAVGDPVEAYKLYSKLIDNENTNIGITALKKAYVISSQNNIDVEPEAVLAKISNSKINPENTLSEFWTRMGIDSYNQKDFTKAKECFGYAKENKNGSLDLIIQLYEAKIQLDEAKKSEKKTVAKELETGLKDIETRIWDSDVNNISDTYYSVMIYVKACEEQWKAIPELYKKIQNPDSQANYLVASSYYKYMNYGNAEEIISKDLTTEDNIKLYASILSKQKKYQEADVIYGKLDANKLLKEADLTEYSKVLCNLKKWEKAKQIAEKTQSPVKYYVCGISDFALGNIKEAKEAFDKYISLSQDGESEKANAVFYTAYSSFKLADYETSYKEFDTYFTKYAHSQKMLFKGYEVAAKSAIMFGDYEKAALQSEAMIKIAGNEDDRYAATVFCSQVYADSGNYQQAVKTMETFVNSKSDYVIPALFQTATIYEKSGNVDNADNVFSKIAADYPGTQEAEEAMYRCGEIYYSVKSYKKAEERFTRYIYNYVNGKFTDAAYYFSGECNLYMNNYNRSIMQNTNLLANYADSIYAYGAGKNLMQAYYAENRYADALDIAKTINKKYREQANYDGISEKITELEKIVAGTDRRIVEKITEYEKAGKTGTKKGRIAGSELVKLYAKSDFTADVDKAFALAKEILEKQTAADEAIYAAENAEFIALYHRNHEENQKAAEMYLKVAEYYRSDAEKELKAAAALYSATEAFVAAGLTADGKATADFLIQLYPNSRQAERVRALIR